MFCHEYILTTTGEVVCLNEYGCRIARNPQVHVIIIQDSNASLKISSPSFIHPDTKDWMDWQELYLSDSHDRSGRTRLHFLYWCDVGQASNFVKKSRKK